MLICSGLTFAQKKESDTIKSDDKLKDIEEIVMVGYGSQKKENVTGSRMRLILHL